MNLFDFPNCQVILDYGHNEEAYKELENYLNTMDCDKKIGIIGVAGDRRKEDIIKIGFLSAKLFDEIIIRHDQEGRGRSNNQLTNWLFQGINESEESKDVKVISNELEAISYALEQVVSPTLIYYSVEEVFNAIKHLKHLQNLTKEQGFYET